MKQYFVHEVLFWRHDGTLSDLVRKAPSASARARNTALPRSRAPALPRSRAPAVRLHRRSREFSAAAGDSRLAHARLEHVGEGAGECGLAQRFGYEGAQG